MPIYHAEKDGFHNVTMGSWIQYGFECISKMEWVIACDEFTYSSPIIDTNADSVWDRAIKMYKKEISRDV